MNSGMAESVIAIGAGVLSMASLMYSWITWRSRANTKRIVEVEGRMDQVEGDLKELEVGMLRKTYAEIGEVHKRVDAIDKQVGRIEGELKGISRTLTLINQHLIENSPK